MCAQFSKRTLIICSISLLLPNCYTYADCPPLIYVDGENDLDNFGWTVTAVGDVNNDDVPDFAVGAPNHDQYIQDSGAVYVFSGSDGMLIYKFNGEDNKDFYGMAIAAAGDVNRDQYDDIIVGAYQNDSGASWGGEAYVYSGLDGSILYTFTGTQGSGKLGTSVGGVSDLNMDGYPDLMVGAPGEDPASVYLYSGKTGELIYTLTAGDRGSAFGSTIASIGDTNGDYLPEIVVGAPETNYIGYRTGKAYVYDGATFYNIAEFRGEQNDGRLGYCVAAIGDADMDEVPDFAISEPFWKDPYENELGVVYIVSGANYSIINKIYGEGYEFGKSIAGGFDVDGDLASDLIVGAPGYGSGSDPDIGRAYIYSGIVSEVSNLRTLKGHTSGIRYGASVAVMDDVNNDGLKEILVGVPTYREEGQGEKFGRCYVYDLSICEGYKLIVEPLTAGLKGNFTVTGATPLTMQYLVYSLVGLGDTNVKALGITLHLKWPVLAANKKADSNGQVLWHLPVPHVSGGSRVWIQTAEQGRTTDVSMTTIRK